MISAEGIGVEIFDNEPTRRMPFQRAFFGKTADGTIMQRVETGLPVVMTDCTADRRKEPDRSKKTIARENISLPSCCNRRGTKLKGLTLCSKTAGFKRQKGTFTAYALTEGPAYNRPASNQ